MSDLKVSFKTSDASKNWDIIRKNLKKIASFREQTTKNESKEIVVHAIFSDMASDEISISEFSIAPTLENIKKTNKVGIKERRASRLNDEYMHQYLRETKAARDLRRRLHLPVINNNATRRSSRWNFFDLTKLKIIDELEPAYPKYQPTYQLEPKIKFNSLIAEHLIQDLINTYLSIVNVSQVMSSKSSIKSSIDHLCTQIKSRIKPIADNRYKLIVSCNIIQQKYQGVILATKCLWDTENDVCVTVKEVHKNYVFIINLFAVYHE